ncbi:VACUOLAR PROTEIN SORTING (VPS33), putative [Babesia bigemina]|uniref:VACUOLAR PROTEIN SORTING (VPS33), putative n=1 Tax=Babesia bigemina TaxID=5866 RepID=A0A061DCH9_BABBI|nr:VACUOLAR PROTEIN SORTING (VPS33), putative [Babesia bigemina]CDR96724.1 VACUOLAR PROTEIN SORTING (VPS33), putative [Babesia bigemina]|eukprot:XP_012768910.1 VACUOLAR PROTEIN SORTING (VPS33), putative [Babesia bigemina]
MSLVDRVASDARAELLSSIANVIVSIERSQSAESSASSNDVNGHRQVPYRVAGTVSSPERGESQDSAGWIRQFISKGNKLNVNCTQDVHDLVSHLFATDELSALGLDSFKTLAAQQSWRSSPRKGDGKATGGSYTLYMIRPTLPDASQLKSVLHYDRSECYVLCLPEVSDMFPGVLQGMLGKSFTVLRGIGGHHGNRVVHLYSCNVHMAPVESCVLSMFISRSFQTFYAEGDPMASWFYAKAFEHLESRIFDGAVPRVTCLGHLSRLVGEVMLKGRRDSAADLIILGSERSHSGSDMPYLTKEMNENRYRKQGTAADSAETQSAKAGDKGSNASAQATTDTMRLLRQSSVVDEAVLIDRYVDLVTPMCLNFTYEGLLDNLFGVVQGHAHLPPGVVEGSAGAAPIGILDQYRSNIASNRGALAARATQSGSVLTLSSPLYKDIRWMNYSEVGKYLHQRALQVHKGYERGDLSTLGEMDAFVKKFKNLQKEHSELSVHVNLMSWLSSLVNGDLIQLLQHMEDTILQCSSDVKPDDSKLASITAKLFNKPCDPCVALFLDLIFWNVDVNQLYRLLVLASQTRDGIKSSDLQNIKRAVVDQYGFNQLLAMHELERMGMVRINDAPDGLRWSRLCKKLNLLVDRDTGTADYSMIFGGYAPISLRLYQLIVLSRGIGSIQSELRLLNCPVSVLRQKGLVADQKRQEAKAATYKLLGYLGGVTLGEIAAVAYLNQKQSQQILLLTTDIVGMRNMLKVDA